METKKNIAKAIITKLEWKINTYVIIRDKIDFLKGQLALAEENIKALNNIGIKSIDFERNNKPYCIMFDETGITITSEIEKDFVVNHNTAVGDLIHYYNAKVCSYKENMNLIEEVLKYIIDCKF